MEQQLSISESEWRVMKIVWSNSPQTLPEILDRLKETGWSKTTIQTYLARLVKAIPGIEKVTLTASLRKAAVF